MFIITHKRRRDQKTNYKKRLALVRSGKTRLVIRRSVKNMRVQFVDFEEKGDKTIASAFSTELRKFGWDTSKGNLPSAYLTGLLAGMRAKSKNVNEAILDLGLQVSTKGSRIYAALKGVADAGINVPHSEKIIPKDERIKGQHISEDMPKKFEETKNKILETVK